MLGIEPLELHFPSELGNGISRCVELTNDTDSYFAFIISPSNSSAPAYEAQPNKGIVPPRRKHSVTITLLPSPETALPHGSYKLYVLSTRVDGDCLRDEDITEDLFDEDVDKVDLNITRKSKVEKIVRHK
ncbi:hypothetical protein PR202_gb13434 [Eleusine coracana subsp. coracana]|uniref:MSP domain-containing protein n=1 Tax=Eleusine coracana subsp. coracana TaxID=191504 RepID=A0AAV5EQF4_ELECO|nr:hypothetical protein PR202_gb13434 [Eleusine coracana subsp. coracana]